MNSRFKVAMAVVGVVLGATVFTEFASAQMRPIGPAARTRFSSRLVGRAGFGRAGFARRPYGPFLPGSAYLPPYLYPPYDYDEFEQAAEPAPAPPVVVVQSAPTPPPAASPAESVVLENRDGQWVRISNSGPLPAVPQSAQTGAKEPATPPRPKPTVLVFRDGHNEEVERYMITGNFIFASANYWSTGSWTRRIPIADLDLSATQKMNEERGVMFSLPSGPNQVILRP